MSGRLIFWGLNNKFMHTWVSHYRVIITCCLVSVNAQKVWPPQGAKCPWNLGDTNTNTDKSLTLSQYLREITETIHPDRCFSSTILTWKPTYLSSSCVCPLFSLWREAFLSHEPHFPRFVFRCVCQRWSPAMFRRKSPNHTWVVIQFGVNFCPAGK